jgi:hypothetical protein
MAIVQNPITGRTKKAFGTAVFSKQFGKNTMRTKPVEVKNPKTVGQVTQRNKFATTVDLVRQVLPLINEVYAGSLRNMSPFNKITSINVKNAFAGDPPVLDHSKVSLCHFVGSSLSNVTVNGLDDQIMDIVWEPNTQNADELASMLTFVLFNCTTNKAVIYYDAAPRAQAGATIVAPLSWVGDYTALHVVTTDYTQKVSNKPMRVIKFAPGNELSGRVK